MTIVDPACKALSLFNRMHKDVSIIASGFYRMY